VRTNIGQRFGENLKRQRKRAAMSQEEVAVRASMHLTTISLIERGVRLPRADSIARLAGALEVDAGALFEGIAWQPGSVRYGQFKPDPADTL
jgi:transcriptional regulator with XRE-family HTH domain